VKRTLTVLGFLALLAFWSINASTIVTTKYFRGAVGSDTRESSLRQLIDRVVLTYTQAGREYGYFATPEDAEIFEHELTWMLLHQVFSFNSPVWFNVGTPAPQQGCFGKSDYQACADQSGQQLWRCRHR
jgi:ribonucleotide reductase alpha subunit